MKKIKLTQSTITKIPSWDVLYDVEADSISLIEKELSPYVSIHYINDDIAVYVDKNNTVKGLFLEYFLKNYLEHAKDTQKIKQKLLTIRQNQSKSSLIKLDKTIGNMLAKNLQVTLRNQVL